MSRILLALVGLLFASGSPEVLAQYETVERNRAASETKQRAVADAVRKTYIGREFWVVPNPKAILRLTFIEPDSLNKPLQKEFVLTEPVSFVVDGFAPGSASNYVEIRFKDQKTAFIRENVMFETDPKAYPLFSELYSGKEAQSPSEEYILPMSPEDLRIAQQQQRKKAVAAAAAWKARGGVSIGMTAAQVRQSNWGGPQHINRTTGSHGVHEQWVYGGGNYIYLQNGRVTSIQN